MKYRPEIDGLRAVAVVPVLIFHLGLGILPGGYLGVDIFFVISGYLITTILLGEIESKSFSLLNFYERRARRILPALFLVIAVSIPFAYWLMPNTTFENFLGGARSASLFYANFHYWQVVDYFLPGAEMQPLVHTWSLAVEEQFYVVFPIALFLAFRSGLGPRGLLVLCFLACLVSLLVARWAQTNAPIAMFYLTPARVWELGAGALCALLLFYPDKYVDLQKSVSNRLADFLALVGLVTIFYTMVTFHRLTPVPSFPAIFPIIGCVLVILFSRPGGIVARALSLPILVGIGLISYSLYLWHQPVFVFYRYWALSEISPTAAVGLIALVTLLAYVTWRFVEQPFRRRDLVSRTTIFRSSFAGMIGLAAVATAALNSGIVENRAARLAVGNFDSDKHGLAWHSYDWLRRDTGDPQYRDRMAFMDQPGWFDLTDPRTRVTVVGNSHSTDCYNLFVASEVASRRFQVSRFNSALFSLDRAKNNFFESENYQNTEIVFVCTRLQEEETPVVKEEMTALIERVRADGKEIVLTQNVFNFVDHHDFSLADRKIAAWKNRLNDAYTLQDLATSINSAYFTAWKRIDGERLDLLQANEIILQLGSELGVPVLDRMDLLCDETAQLCYSLAPDLTRHMWDYGHYTLAGAEFFATRADEIGWFEQIP